ncbi:hypothetical protein BU17DRAFT_60027 [Hysterangium stoloniferum]|nr:hypothetical protein BU17DRAFT_60027 [Hysterangium stoloniferum]
MSVNHVVTQIKTYNIVRFSWVTAATVMVYDYGLTIEHEKSTWQRRWTLGKCLYLFDSLRPFSIFLVSQTNCKDLKTKALICTVITRLCQTLAVTPLFGGSFTLAAILSSQVLVIMIALVLLVCLLLTRLGVPVAFGMQFGFTGCGIDALPHMFWFGILPSLILETTLCTLMILKAVQNHLNGYGSPLLSQMLQDSISVTLFVACIYGLGGQESRGLTTVAVVSIILYISDGKVPWHARWDAGS